MSFLLLAGRFLLILKNFVQTAPCHWSLGPCGPLGTRRMAALPASPEAAASLSVGLCPSHLSTQSGTQHVCVEGVNKISKGKSQY